MTIEQVVQIIQAIPPNFAIGLVAGVTIGIVSRFAIRFLVYAAIVFGVFGMFLEACQNAPQVTPGFF